MKKLAFSSILAVAVIALLGSCDPGCKTCTGESVSIIDYGNGSYDTTMTSIAGGEICDEALIAAEAGPISATATSNSITTTTTITYTCTD
jgi:hypothetical protein